MVRGLGHADVRFPELRLAQALIARRVALANSSVNHHVPIRTPMPGMRASQEDVVTITTEPGSGG